MAVTLSPSGTRRILLVEDDERRRTELVRALVGAELYVTACNRFGLAEVLSALRADVVIVDCRSDGGSAGLDHRYLPEADGYDATAVLATAVRLARGAHVVALLEWRDEAVDLKLRTLGVDETLPLKVMTPARIRQLVDAWFPG